MPKLRVYQLAKELGVQSALILELLDRLGQDVRSDLSVLDGGTAELVRARITNAIAAAKKRIEEERAVEETQPEAEAPAAAETPPPVAQPVAAAEAPAEMTVAAKPATARPAAAVKPAPTVPAAAPGAAATPATPAVPGARKPRVFPARRLVPHPTLKTGPARPTAAPGAARVTPPFRPGGPGAPGARPGPPGTRPMPPGVRPGPPHRGKRRRKDRERHVAPLAAKPKDLPPVPAEVTLSEAVTVKELAEKLNRKSKDVIAKLIARGVLATINQPLDPEVAVAVAKEFGSEANIISFEEEAQLTSTAEVDKDEPALDEPDAPADNVSRPPVVTVMGHVDHGKTSLLDAIRTTDVAGGEAGGITQHIGAYQVEARDRRITFLDTPGHEAFTMMRARGSKVTDIVVLVVAADDGVKPQTLEAIDHAKAAGVPMVIAINKIDKPNAVPDRVKQQLAEKEVVIEEYGGDVVACEISAKQRTGIEELLEMILLVADLKELRANPDRTAAGVVLETKLDRARGIVSTVLVQNGTLRIGDPFIAGATTGKVRAMADERGHRVREAGPSVPVEVIGFATEPGAGDSFQAVTDESKARQIASFRREKIREASQIGSARRSLETLSRDVASGEVRELPIILRADTQGSAEALQKSLADLPSDKIRINVLRSSIGAITRADVLLATASNAVVVGFNVRPDRDTAELARQEDVELRLYTVIYDLLQDIQQAMIGMLAPTERESVLGQAEVRQLFKVPKIGVIAGCYVNDGKVARTAEVRLLRDNVVIYTGKVGSLKRFKDDVSEVKQGYECGIGIAGYNDLKEGDFIEFFQIEKVVAQTL